LERKHVRELIAAKRDTPMAANNLLRMLRILGKFAIAEEWRNDDPTNGVRGIRVRSTGFHSWTEDEIDIFQQRWPVGTRECLAFRLLLYTAQRRADVIRMGRQHVRCNAIFVRQQKTGQELLIPIHPKLREVLDLETGQLTFLTTAYGAQFSAAGFGNWFRASCNAAGLRHCSAHGLRKASARRFAEQGCSANEIAAWTGHTTLKEVAGYTKAASQQLLAQRAMQRTLHEQNLANPKIGLAKKGRK
jgi:integrase